MVVFANENDSQFMIYDLISNKPYLSNETWLSQTNIGSKVILTDSGLSIPDENIIKIIGKDFI